MAVNNIIIYITYSCPSFFGYSIVLRIYKKKKYKVDDTDVKKIQLVEC